MDIVQEGSWPKIVERAGQAWWNKKTFHCGGCGAAFRLNVGDRFRVQSRYTFNLDNGGRAYASEERFVTHCFYCGTEIMIHCEIPGIKNEERGGA